MLTPQIHRSVFHAAGISSAMGNYGINVPSTVKKKQKTDNAKAQKFKNKNKRIHCTQI